MKIEQAIKIIVDTVRDPDTKEPTAQLREAIKAVYHRKTGFPHEAAIDAILRAMGLPCYDGLNRDELYSDLLLAISQFEIMAGDGKFAKAEGAKMRIDKLREIRRRALELQELLADASLELRYSPPIQSLGLPARLQMLAQTVQEMPAFRWTPAEAVSAVKNHFGYQDGSLFDSLAGRRLVQIYEKHFHATPKRSRKSGDPDDPYIYFVQVVLAIFNIAKSGKRLTDKGSKAYRPETILAALPPSGESLRK